MNTHTTTHAQAPDARRGGSALVIVMCLAGVLLLASLSLIMTTGTMARQSHRIYRGVQALAIAEAGVADVIEKMGTNYEDWVDTVYTQAFADGSFVVSTRTDEATGNVTIWSDGAIGDEARTTVVELLGDTDSMRNRALGAGDAMLAEGDITLDTGAIRVNGSCHANQNVLHTTGNTTINGDVSACGVVEVNVTSGHTVTPNADNVTIPTWLPFTEWKEAAQNGGIYYSGNTTVGKTTLTPGNGVVYVDGDVSIANRSGLVGTLVAAGTVTIVNRFDQSPYNTNWPAILAGVDVNLHNRNEYYGVIFAGHDISSRNRRTVNGAMVALNNIEADNQLTINPLTQPPAYSPNTTTSPPPEVIVGGWLR